MAKGAGASVGSTPDDAARAIRRPYPETGGIARGENRKPGETQAAALPHSGTDTVNPFAPLQGELKNLKKLEIAVWGSGRPLRMVNSCQWSADKEPYIHLPVGPRQISLEFLIDTGAQISVLDNKLMS